MITRTWTNNKRNFCNLPWKLSFGRHQPVITRQRFASSFSSSSSPSNDDSKASTKTLTRYGLGGQHWKQFDPSSYQNLIYNALTHTPHQVDYFEVAGPDGGEIAMVGAIQTALERLESEGNPSLISPITITTRIGYRSPSAHKKAGEGSSNDNNKNDQPNLMPPLPGDVVLPSPDDTSLKTSTYNMPANVVHNIHPQYVIDTIQSSTLWELQDIDALKDRIKFVFLLHNPETQVVELLRDEPKANHDDRQEFLKGRLAPAMDALQEFCSSSSNSTFSSSASVSFGVVSNGLGIPPKNDHPMHLDSDLIVTSSQLHDKFSTVQVPANLLEMHGWDVARYIKSQCKSVEGRNVEVAAIRPLSAYPDLGTGDSYPFRLVDYSLPSLEGTNKPTQSASGSNGLTDGLDLPSPSSSSSSEYATDSTTKPSIGAQYTNEMTGIPVVYQMALQAAMSHFDAEPLLEAKLERDLTTEERETLDGCKLVQSMIHDLDAELQDIRSFAKHEDELYGRIIPLLYDTFEAMDDQTSDVLQTYFAAYAVAVRYVIAQKTRELLKNGEGSSSSKKTAVTYPDIPEDMTLQEYAVRRMLSEPSPFDRIIMGSSTLQDFEHQTHIMETILSEVEEGKDVDPMDRVRRNRKEQKKNSDIGDDNNDVRETKKDNP